MAKAKAKPKNVFLGLWSIISMSAWEDEYLDEEVESIIDMIARHQCDAKHAIVGADA